MLLLREIILTFLDTLTAHLALTAYLLAVTDERAVWKRLKKLPVLLLSPLTGTLFAAVLYTVPELRKFQYFIISGAFLVMCALWVRWAWRFSFWRAFAAVCMASVFQVTGATVSWWMPLWEMPEIAQFAVAAGLHLGIGAAASLLLYKLRFGVWFRFLLDNEPAAWRTALLLFALEAIMEMFLILAHGIQPQYLACYYLLVMAMVIMITVLVVYLAQRFDTARKLQAQKDVIVQQRFYEQELEIIQHEVRTFRHDYKNLLASLYQQAGAGELEGLRRTLSELDAGFDLQLGRKIQVSAQIGNLQIPEVRSLLLSKLTAMREKAVTCRLEALYPVKAVDMDVWDLVRCLGILIDNAMEAALDAERPWVEIVLLAQDEGVFLRVSNPYTNIIEPGKMWNEGWSTKGKGRGVGLSSYQRILENYPNASHCTGWENGVFVQELTVEDRR